MGWLASCPGMHSCGWWVEEATGGQQATRGTQASGPRTGGPQLPLRSQSLAGTGKGPGLRSHFFHSLGWCWGSSSPSCLRGHLSILPLPQNVSVTPSLTSPSPSPEWRLDTHSRGLQVETVAVDVAGPWLGGRGWPVAGRSWRSPAACPPLAADPTFRFPASSQLSLQGKEQVRACRSVD